MIYSVEALNRELVFVMQACLGEISQNFLSISLTPVDESLVLRFVLERENEEDRDAIEEIASDFYAMHEDDPLIRVEVEVAPESRTLPQSPSRVIYVRKESNGR